MSDRRPDGEGRAGRNKRFADQLHPDLRNDYLSYVRLHVGDPDAVELADPEIVARYCATAAIGRWQHREASARLRLVLGKGYKPQRGLDFYEEDIATMMNHTLLQNPRPTQKAACDARTRFAESTRQSSFSLSLGVREIRLLAEQPWESVRWLRPEATAGLQRLVEKGLLVHEIGSPPRLSKAGELLRRLLIESRHIVESPSPGDGLRG